MAKNTKAGIQRSNVAMKKMTGDAYVAIGIMGVALLFGCSSFAYPSLKSKLLPAVVSWFMFILAGIQLKNEIFSKKDQKNTAERINEEWDSSDTESVEWWRKNIMVFCWLIGLFLFTYLFGFIIGIVIFVFAFLKFNQIKWVNTIITTLISSLLIYIVFVVVLKANLFKGIITEAILPFFH